MSLRLDDIELDRYYPPTDQDKVNQIGLDYDYLRGHSDLDFKQEGLKELGRITSKAAGMLKDDSSAQFAYLDASHRANDLAREVEKQQKFLTT